MSLETLGKAIAEDPEVEGAGKRLRDHLDDFSQALLESAYRQLFTGDLRGLPAFPAGSDPFDQWDLIDLLLKTGEEILEDAPVDGAHIVLGREGFDTDLLEIWAQSPPLPMHFYSQEAFLNFWLFGVEPGYYRGDPRIEAHPGLSYVAGLSADWPWPTTDLSGEGEYRWEGDHWADESPLYARFGYTVNQGDNLSRRRRRQILHKALTAPPDPLPLRQVAEHIAWLVRLWRGKDEERYEVVISRWESDLAFLRRRYYDDGFRWPATE